MADWNDIPESQDNPSEPITADWAKAVGDNPVAIAEGASGAPRLRIQALEELSVGTFPAFSLPVVDTVNNGSIVLFSHIFAQKGEAEFRVTIAGSGAINTRFTKNETVLSTQGGTGLKQLDITFDVGEYVELSVTVGSGSVTPSDVQVLTDGQRIFPGYAGTIGQQWSAT